MGFWPYERLQGTCQLSELQGYQDYVTREAAVSCSFGCPDTSCYKSGNARQTEKKKEEEGRGGKGRVLGGGHSPAQELGLQ